MLSLTSLTRNIEKHETQIKQENTGANKRILNEETHLETFPNTLEVTHPNIQGQCCLLAQIRRLCVKNGKKEKS